MKPTHFVLATLAASSFLFACSGADTGNTGDGTPSSSKKTDTDNTDRSGTGKSGTDKPGTDKSGTDKPSKEKTCKASSLNGRCTEGPKKGSSCCYAPSDPEDPPCKSSNECDTVCEFCE